jgi:hypothetical protein
MASTATTRTYGLVKALLALGAFLLLCAPARAGTVWGIGIEENLAESTMNPAGLNTQYPAPGPVISVLSNDGESYHFAQSGQLSFGLGVWSQCSINSADSEVKVSIGAFSQVLASGMWASHDAGLTDGKIIQLKTPYLPMAMPQTPVEACNQRLLTLENGGIPRWQALQEGFSILVSNAYTAKLNVSCGKLIIDKEERTAALNGWIRCMPSALAQAPPEPPAPPEPASTDIQVAFGVSGAAVMLPQAIKTAACPTQLLAQAQITTTGPGVVKYRWVHNDAEGPVATVTFHQGGTAKLESNLTVGATGQGGLAATPGGQSGGGGFGFAQTTAANQVQGHVRVKMVDTPGVQVSDAAHYTVTCDDTAGPDGMAVTPQPPTPQIPLGPQHIGTPAPPPEATGTRDARRAMPGVRPDPAAAEPATPATPARRAAEGSDAAGPASPARTTTQAAEPPAAAPPRTAIRMQQGVPAAGCPFEANAQCQLDGTWQNCCALSARGQIVPLAAPGQRGPGGIPVADAACVRRCEANPRAGADEQALAQCYARCARPGAQKPATKGDATMKGSKILQN